MIFHIAVCSPDAGLRSGLERQCMEFFARRADACIVEHLPDTDALLRKDGEGVRYDLYLLELSGSAAPVGLAAAGELRRRGRRAPLAFVARTTAHAYSAYKVDALQYLLLPVRQRELSALLARATEPEYGPSVTVNTAEGLRALPYAGIEYLECTSTSPAGRTCPPCRCGCRFLRWHSLCWRMGAFCSPTAPMWSIWPRRTCFLPGSCACAAGPASPSPAGGRVPCGTPSSNGCSSRNTA